MNTDITKEQAEVLAAMTNDNKQPDVREEFERGMPMPVKDRYIPDAECKQGKCANQTTGCFGKCHISQHPEWPNVSLSPQPPQQQEQIGEAKPVAWVRFRSDWGYEGPIMDCDKRMDGRRESGAWTPLYTAPLNAIVRRVPFEWKGIR